MAESHSSTTPEATKASSTAHPPVQDMNVAAEMESDRSSIVGDRMVRAIGGGSPMASPDRFAGALGQMQSASGQAGMLRQLQRSYGNSYCSSVIQRKADGNGSGAACEKKEKEIQRNGEGDISAIPEGFESEMQRSGSGNPLDRETRSFMESRFGRDFSNVRVHTDSTAADASEAVQAQAFTTGRDIYFSRGRFQPQTKSGQQLLAHELTHVVQQQTGAVASAMAKPVLGISGDVFEQEADAIAQQVTAENSIPQDAISSLIPQGVVARQMNEEAISSEISSTESSEPEMLMSLNIVKAHFDNKYPWLVSVENAPSEEAIISELYGEGISVPLNKKKVFTISEGLVPRLEIRYVVIPEMLVPFYRAEFDRAMTFRKIELDSELEEDFIEIKYSLKSDEFGNLLTQIPIEQKVIDILWRWAKEPFLNYWAGEDLQRVKESKYLDELFLKLFLETIDVGIITTQYSSLYDLIFNHFYKVDEVKTIRDTYSKRYRGNNGIKEMSFGSFFWEEVKEGKIRDQIFAYGKGLAKGARSAIEGTFEFAHTLITDPAKAWENIKNIPTAIKNLWKNRSELWQSFVNASPEKQAEMIGKLFGEVVAGIATSAVGGAFVQGVSKLAKLPGLLGRIGRALEMVIKVGKIPGAIVGKTVGAVKTVVWKGVTFAAEGAIWAAKGVYKLGTKILRGTWSIAEKVVEGIKQKIYYFFDDTERLLWEIPPETAGKYIDSVERKLTAEGEALAGEKLITSEAEGVASTLKHIPEEFASACAIGSLVCPRGIPKIIREKVGHPPHTDLVPDPKGEFNLRGSKDPGYADLRAAATTSKLRKTVLDHPETWTDEFKEALKAAKKKGLDWPTDANGKAWEVHHVKPIDFGGDNVASNLIPIPKDIHTDLTTWWRSVKREASQYFSDSEWKALIGGSKEYYVLNP
jgi:hypothetical protein